MTESQEKIDENEPTEQVESESKFDLTDIIKTFLSTDKFEKILATFEKNKETDLEAKRNEFLNKKVANDSNLSFWKFKLGKEFFTVLLILGCILFLAYFDKIESDTLGTLLGSVIGYSIGNFSASNKN